jgi:hypothetical protein
LLLAVVLVATLAGALATTAAALRFDDAKPCVDTEPLFVCPSGNVGKPYSIQLVGAGGCGPALPYQYRILNGALPGGLSLSSSGLISGVPTGAGSSRFWVELSDENPPSAAWCIPKTAERELIIVVEPGLSIENQSLAPATVGQSYSATLTASLLSTTSPRVGRRASATWSVHSGALAAGVALSPDGVLSGTPTTEGSYQFVVRADSGGQVDMETLTITVRQAVVIAPLDARWSGVHGSEVGIPVSATLSATGGTGTFTWALAEGSDLPTGVVFGADGTISGTPRVAGTFAFTAQATDSEGRTATLNATLHVAAKLAFKTVALRAAKVGKLYSAKLKTSGGVSPLKWKLLRGTLPRGVNFAKKLGLFTGTPKREGSYRVTVQAIDGYGIKAQKTFVLVVTA